MSEHLHISDTLFSVAKEDLLTAKPFSVSELVLLLKNEVEQKHRFVRVVGEISSFKKWRSGHCYFDIKDDKALIPAVMFKPHADRLHFEVNDGLEVLFSGRISVYAQTSRLQMIVESMEPLGQGALALAFLQLKTKLLKEGLFDAAHKKPILNKLNFRIGLVTSSHGAVLRDMLRVIKARMPKASIMLAEARVQGAGAKEEIASAIKLLDEQGHCDVIIVGRGGGSLEDLWAFNEEIVARAIFSAKTPIISAVGHETDNTISDLVADLRAATPTHAAQMVVPDHVDLLEGLAKAEQRLASLLRAKLAKEALRLANAKKRLVDPRVLLFRHWQNLDMLAKRLFKLAPEQKLIRDQSKLAFYQDHLKQAISLKLSRVRADLEKMSHKLEALSPLAVLQRGFSVVQKKDAVRVISSVSDVELDEELSIRLADGVIKAIVCAK